MRQSEEACANHHHHGSSHHHDHDHGGAHDRGHGDDHGTALIEENGVSLTLMEHSGSLVATYEIALTCSLDDAKDRLVKFCKSVGNAVYDAGGVVGHIKAVVQDKSGSFRISYTFGEPDIMPIEGGAAPIERASADGVSIDGVSIEGVCIVLAVEERWFAGLIEREIRILA